MSSVFRIKPLLRLGAVLLATFLYQVLIIGSGYTTLLCSSAAIVASCGPPKSEVVEQLTLLARYYD
jgi:hypothetical protein